MAEMYKYLQGAIHYPDQALKDNVEGKVYIDFIVGADGKVREAKIRRSLRQDLDAEAMCAVNAMPPWTPGKLGGKAVSTRFVLPISFVSGKSPAPSSKKVRAESAECLSFGGKPRSHALQNVLRLGSPAAGLAQFFGLYQPGWCRWHGGRYGRE
jgi:TonB family protein